MINRSFLSSPMGNEQLERVAPSIFAESKHESRSARYTYIPTIAIVDAMRNEGFMPVMAAQSRARDESRKDFTKHMIRFRRQDAVQVGDSLPELVLVNSHDGTSSYQLMAGIFRLVCSNGLIVKSSDFGDIRVHHKGDVVHEVLNASHQLVQSIPETLERAREMSSIALEYEQQRAFAAAALTLRYDVEESPITPDQLLRQRRHADGERNLWTTLNQVQENIIRGGLRGTFANGKQRKTRAVNSVGENVRLNTALWTLAEEMRKIVAPNN